MQGGRSIIKKMRSWLGAEQGRSAEANLFPYDESQAQDVIKNGGAFPLHYAAQKGYMDYVQHLLQLELDVDMQNANGATALMLASIMGHFSIVQVLLDKGADVRKRDRKFDAVLIYAVTAYADNIDLVRLLLDRGAVVDENSKDGCTALISAASKGHVGVAKLLLESGAEINMQDGDGSTALIYAAQEGYVAMVELLLQRGANVDIVDGFGKVAKDYVEEELSYSNIKIQSYLEIQFLLQNAARKTIVALSSEFGSMVAKPASDDSSGQGYLLRHYVNFRRCEL